MFLLFFSTYADASMYHGSSCRGFTLLVQLLKSKNSVFASSEHVQIITFTQMVFGQNETSVKRADSSLLFPLLMKALERYVSPRVYTIRSFCSHIWRYKYLLSRKSSHKDTPISVIFWTFLLEKLTNSVDPQGNTSSHQGLRQQQWR